MITCPNCNKELADGAKFCNGCGSKIEEKIFCPNCGKETSPEYAFCQNCGKPLSGEAPKPKTDIKAKKLPLISKLKQYKNIGCIIIAAVLVLIIAISVLSGSKKGIDRIIYLKDGEMFASSVSKISPRQISSHLVENATDIDTQDANFAYECSYYCRFAKDGKMLFYPDKLAGKNSGRSIFCRYLDEPEKEPIKIDSDIISYSVSENGKTVTYIKGEERNLYQSDLVDKEKIDSDISRFSVTDDGKTIVYLSKENGLYIKKSGKDKEKIDSDVSSVYYADDDMKMFCYIKEDSLYKKEDGKEKVKIASDVSSVIKVYESGEIYYLKSNTGTIILSDFVEDDMASSDASLTEPVAPNYPSYWNYTTNSDYQAALEKYQKDYENYQTARDAWNKKVTRDSIRTALAQQTLERVTYSLLYNNGKEDKKLTDDYITRFSVLEKSPAIIYSVFDLSSANKVKISEITGTSDVERAINSQMYSSAAKYIAVKDSASVIEQNKAQSIIMTPDGKTVYFLDDVNEDTYIGNIYKMPVSGTNPQKPELFDSEVSADSFYLLDNGKLAYFKDVNNSKGDFYIDKQKVDYDVSLYSFCYSAESDTVVYITDFNSEKSCATLKMYKGGKSTKIADEVHDFYIAPGDEIFYLYDYSINRNTGELYMFKNKKAVKIDSDVTYYVPIGEKTGKTII